MSENARVTVSTTASARRPSLLSRVVRAIPPEPPSSPISYSPQLVAYVVAVCAVAVLVAVGTMQAPSDVPTLAVGAVAIFGLVLVMVRSFGGVDAPWSPTALGHLALSLAFGPAGALTAAVAASAATLIRLRAGWFRTLLNLANFFLANVAAWAAFQAVTRPSGAHGWIAVLGGLAAGGASYLVSSVVLSGAIRLASGLSIWTFFRSTVEVIPYELFCGLGAAGFSVFHAQGGSPYLVMWLAPVVCIQGLLVVLAIRANAHAAETERHARERVELLQRVITAAETERFEIAADLHDGPVAALAGIAMSLGDGQDADDLRQVQRELRELIFRYSPHDLHKPGRLRQEITDKQLAALRERGVDAEVAVPETVPLDRAGLELVHRVCGEAVENVLRHAHARRVSVALVVEGAEVILTIDDDGRGFSAEDVERQRAAGHFGTRFLAEKAELAHGTFAIQSEPGEGAHVRLSLPVAAATTPGP